MMRSQVCCYKVPCLCTIAHLSTGHRNAVRLLAEQSHREEKRQELLAQRSALHQGQQIVRNLQQKKYSDDSQLQAPSVNDVGPNPHSMLSPLPEEIDDEM
jgi:SOS response regulatory protein OraA/RecX